MTAGETMAADSRRMILRQRSARKKRYAKAVALLVLAVVAGIVIGIGGTVLYFGKTAHRRGARAIADAMVARLDSLISLTPEEELRVREVIDARLEEVDAMRRRRFDEIRGVFRNMDGPLESILGAERANVWREYSEKRFDKRRRDMDGRSEMRRGGMHAGE